MLCLVLGLRTVGFAPSGAEHKKRGTPRGVPRFCIDRVVVLTESGSLNFTLKLRIVYAELLERSAFVNSSAKLLSVTFITLSS